MKKIIVYDVMQDGYVYWRTEPVGKHFDPTFKPDLTPKKMLGLGIESSADWVFNRGATGRCTSGTGN